MKRQGRVLGGVLIAWVLLGALAFAQSASSIAGTVSDSTGAVIPGATVTVRNVETGFTRVFTTGVEGRYVVPQIPVGTYEVTVAADGFQTSVRRGITLTVGREAVVNFSMSLGAVAETIEVTGEAPIVETASATVSGLVDSRQMREIPLNARSFIELVPLTAGSAFADNAESEGSPTSGFGKKLSISGGRVTTNTFLLDGADMTDASGTSGSAAGTLAGVEAVREFRVIANAYDAEYGKHAGGVITAVTKSGTNEFHGSLYEFLRNDALDAPSFFDNANNNGEKAPFRRNQFGGAIGGPIVRDKAFFFANYEGLRHAKGKTVIYQVPSRAMRTQFIAEGACSAGCTPDPKILPYLNAYPLPNGAERPEGDGDFSRFEQEEVSHNYVIGRVDYRFSDSDFIFGRFTYDQATKIIPGFTSFQEAKTPNRYVTVEETHVFSPQLLSKTHASFTRAPMLGTDITWDDFKYPDGFESFDGGDVPGRISISGLSNWGGGSTNPKAHVQNNWQGKQDFYWSTGRHAVKFGGHFQRIQFNERSDFHSGGTLSFADRSEFLLGRVGTASFIKPGSDNIRGWRQTVLALYLHDDFAVRPGLTLNLGIRYETVSVPREVNGKVANIRDITLPRIVEVSPETTDVGDPYYLNPSLLAFQPRFGFAWAPFNNQKSAVRGGFGIFDDQILPYHYITSGIRGAPFYSYVDLFARDFPNGIDFPRTYFTQIAAPGAVLPGVKPEFRIFPWNPARAYVMKWSLDIEQELVANMSFGIGFSGSKGTHIVRGNQATNSTPAIIDSSGRRLLLIDRPLPNPNFNRMYRLQADGTTKYHALRLTFNKRFSHGLQFQTSYTWGKSLDVGSSVGPGSEFLSGSNHTGDLYGGLKWYGASAFNVAHTLYSNFVLDLPGRELGGAAGAILGGWSMSGVLRMSSGIPLTISAASPRNGANQLRFVGGGTVDLAPGGDNNPSRPQNRDQYLDGSQFSPVGRCFNTASRPTACAGGPANGESYVVQGNIGRSTAEGPGVINADFTLTRSISVSALGEATHLDFRFEMYNLFNRPNFGVPNTSAFTATGLPNSSFGRIDSLQTDPRQLQFGLKLVF